MITARPGSRFDAVLVLGPSQTGLVGSLGIQVVDPGTTTTILARTTAGINEDPAGSGIYGVELTAPEPPGMYGILWDNAGGGALNPSNSWPDSLTVTIENPTFPGGWSWSPWGWLWPDSDFNLSDQPAGSNPIPSAADVRLYSQLNYADYGYPVPAGSQPDTLQEIVDRAESLFWRITGQTIDQLDAKVAPLVRRVVQGMTEQMAMQGGEDALDTQSDWDLIQSFAAGPYNETRRDPGEMRKAWMLNPVPWISDALWSLLSADRFSFYWHFFSGTNVPSFATSDVYWQEGLAFGEMYGPGLGFYWGA